MADSVPVPLSGNHLKAHLIAHPSGVCAVSWLCLLLPYLGCQVTPFVPVRSNRYTFTHMPPPPILPPCLSLSAFSSLCLLGPWPTWKTHTMEPYDFLKLLPHLVCHAPWSAPTLSQLLGTSGGKGTQRKPQPCHTYALTPPPQE
jgi:hypothetical protein